VGVPRWIAYTHGHWDHVRGGVAFPGHEIITHAHALPGVLDQLALEPGPDPDAGVPTIVMEGPMRLDLGGAVVELIPTPGHAPGSVCAWVPSEGVLYAGDTVVTAIPPVFADGDSATLERTLRSLVGLGAEVLVPGHGRILHGRAEVTACLTARADYLAGIRAEARASLRAGGPDGVVARLPLEWVPQAALDRDLLPDAELRARHERAIRGIVAELGKRPE
jgi:cyclase